MKHRILTAFLLGATTALSLAPITSHAQSSYDYRYARFSPRELDALTAPIALYPDQLLADIMMAATCPAEVRDAADWLASPYNSSLRGGDLEDALQDIDWDPSIKSIVTVPGLLQMMANQMDWTERLGDAFITSEDDVMDSVQRMRQQAYDRGTLRSNNYQRVVLDGDLILIEPARSDSFYFQVYSPADVYGPWRYPEYPAYYLPPPVGYGYGVGFSYGISVPIFRPYWGWHRWDWRNHRINIDRGRWDRFHPGRPPGGFNGGVWRHDPGRRANNQARSDWRSRPVGRPPGQVQPTPQPNTPPRQYDRDDRGRGGRTWNGNPDSSPNLRYGLHGGGNFQGRNPPTSITQPPAPAPAPAIENTTPRQNFGGDRDFRRNNRGDDNGRNFGRRDFGNRDFGNRTQAPQPQAAPQPTPAPTPAPPPQMQQRREWGNNGGDMGRGRGRGGEGGFRNRPAPTAAPAPQPQQQFGRPQQQFAPQPQPSPQSQPTPSPRNPDSSPALQGGLHGDGRGRRDRDQ